MGLHSQRRYSAVRVYQDIVHAANFGVVVDGAVKVDWGAVLSRKDKVVKQLIDGVSNLLKHNGVEVWNGRGIVRDRQTIEVAGEAITADHLIIATGSRPTMHPIPGLQEAVASGAVVDSTGALSLEKIPERLVVVGGGVIGIEFAALFSAVGSEVIVLEKFSILNGLDREVQGQMRRILRRAGVQVFEEADVQRFEGSTVVVQVGGEQHRFTGDAVLVSLGRTPNLDAVASLDLELERGGIKTDHQMQTSIPGVYAIGDVNGKQMLAHTASAEGIAAVENILGNPTHVDYHKIPACVYSFPEIAVVGLTEEEARARGHAVQTGSFPLRPTAKPWLKGKGMDSSRLSRTGSTGGSGVHIVGPDATDLIAEAANALQLEATLSDLAQTIHPHPTLSEALMEAAHVGLGMPIHVAKR